MQDGHRVVTASSISYFCMRYLSLQPAASNSLSRCFPGNTQRRVYPCPSRVNLIHWLGPKPSSVASVGPGSAHITRVTDLEVFTPVVHLPRQGRTKSATCRHITDGGLGRRRASGLDGKRLRRTSSRVCACGCRADTCLRLWTASSPPLTRMVWEEKNKIPDKATGPGCDIIRKIAARERKHCVGCPPPVPGIRYNNINEVPC